MIGGIVFLTGSYLIITGLVYYNRTEAMSDKYASWPWQEVAVLSVLWLPHLIFSVLYNAYKGVSGLWGRRPFLNKKKEFTAIVVKE